MKSFICVSPWLALNLISTAVFGNICDFARYDGKLLTPVICRKKLAISFFNLVDLPKTMSKGVGL